jgi:hypothetical protein
LAVDDNSIPVERIFQIHNSPFKTVLAITGGGAEIIGELLRHGSGSATVLDAVIPYSTDAMDLFLGRKPEKYCSEKTARLMAMVAYQRALDLAKSTTETANPEVIGIGATCKLKAANERESRKHEIHVAIQAACQTGVRTLELTADRTREEEEKIAAFLIFNVLARYYCVPEIVLPDRIETEKAGIEAEKTEITNGIETRIETGTKARIETGTETRTETEIETRIETRKTGNTGIETAEGKRETIIEKYVSVSEAIGNLLEKQSCSPEPSCKITGMTQINLNKVKACEKPEELEEVKDPAELEKMRRIVKTEKTEKTKKPEEIKLVFSGSFDPCHKNHVFMAECASRKHNSPVHFEISLTNVDKPPIDFISLSQRLDSLKKYKDEAFMGGVCLTNAPLFLQKADLFPNSTFIIGGDTFNRLFDAKYYGGKIDTSAILNHFKEKNVRFIVFYRKSVELCIKPEVLEFCEVIPVDEYEDDGTSSTEIRRQHRRVDF